jgi:hypothetical protein
MFALLSSAETQRLKAGRENQSEMKKYQCRRIEAK